MVSAEQHGTTQADSHLTENKPTAAISGDTSRYKRCNLEISDNNVMGARDVLPGFAFHQAPPYYARLRELAREHGTHTVVISGLTGDARQGRVVLVDPLQRGDYLDLMTEIVLQSDAMAVVYRRRGHTNGSHCCASPGACCFKLRAIVL